MNRRKFIKGAAVAGGATAVAASTFPGPCEDHARSATAECASSLVARHNEEE